MREVDVVSTSTKRITVDQVDDELHLFVSVTHTSWSLELTLDEGAELAVAFQRLVEERMREVRGPAARGISGVVLS